jgi:murein DD-endopeptidase MepM/ murein hydrolase activator NlpD
LENVTDVLRVTAPSNVDSVLPFDLASVPTVVFDLSEANPELARLELSDPETFSRYLFGAMEDRQASVGIGRYNEQRVIYRHSPLFNGEGEGRNVHLGIDLFVAPGELVLAPLDGVVHSFADNAGFGNYGPTVILEHQLAGVTFFTLYGHLSSASLPRLTFGERLNASAVLGWTGESWENGGWPPHLHFQIITEIGGWRGDFPGVAAPSELQHFLALCPDPNLILRIPEAQIA